MNQSIIEKYVLKDNYLDIAYKRYQEFMQTDLYDEAYKQEILSELNSYIQNVEINKDTIVEIIKKIKTSNPQEGSFVHWSNTSDLLNYTNSNPEEVAYLLHHLYHNHSVSLAEKIKNFRDKGKLFNSKISLGAPLFGYLLAAYDYKKFPLYKEEVFKDIKQVFGINKKLGPVHENYQTYYDMCLVVYKHLVSQGKVITMLDVQDFFFCLTQYDQPKVESAVEYIYTLANKLNQYKQNDQVFIEAIKELDRETLRKTGEAYRNDTKVNKIRFKMIDQYLETDELDVAQLEKIKEQVNEENERNILQAWTNFTILFQVFYNSVKEKVNQELKTVHQAIQKMEGIEDLDLEENKVLNGFNWNHNFGGTESWLAVYPANKVTHKDAAQLFVLFDENGVRYGLVYGTNHPKRGQENLESITDIEKINYEKIKQKFEEVLPAFIEENDLNSNLDVEGMVREDNKSTQFSTPAQPVIKESEEKRYFWLTSNPSIWSVSEIKEGGAVNYTAYNEKGNKRRVFSAFENAQPGDKILFYESTPRKEIVAQGEVTESLHVVEDDEDKEPIQGVSFRFVEDITPISWEVIAEVEELQQSSPIRNGAQGSLFELTKAEFETILSLEPTQVANADVEIPTISFDKEPSIHNLHFEEEERLLRQVKTALQNEKHIIFIGPPGTGKSKLAKEICTSFDASYKMATATSDWSTYETIGGYRPKSDGTLTFHPGLFLDCFKDHNTNRPANKWLIIDEMNRADIDKAFGSLFSALTGDTITLNFQSESGQSFLLRPQGEDKHVVLNDYEYVIPNDWRLIGTMNTLDKASLYEMSYAFMRRFAFIPVGVPKQIDSLLVQSFLYKWNITDYRYTEELAFVWQQINGYRQIGPAIVEDIAKYTAVEADFTSAIILYVLPQFEGLLDHDIIEFIERVSQLPEIDVDLLRQFAQDFFHMKG
ncbi:AAA family ATPase [Virgibacillus xinjiangensis]|uniref:AAA family ATPase n=1 Tax=Virgibacillus xinjiangensis TaxID=393090 RepID=A0ABV7CWI2_9BACI